MTWWEYLFGTSPLAKDFEEDDFHKSKEEHLLQLAVEQAANSVNQSSLSTASLIGVRLLEEPRSVIPLASGIIQSA